MSLRCYFIFLVASLVMSLQAQFLVAGDAYTYCIMLDPAGDAEHTGRRLEHNFERGLTLQCVEFMQRELAKRLPLVRVVLTRTVGHTAEPLQHAQFANRLGVDLYIHLSLYKEERSRCVWSIYRFSDDPSFKQPQSNQPQLSFVRYDHAYQTCWHETERLCQKVYTLAHKQAANNGFFDCRQPCAIPHASLIGINRPALALEIGLVHDNDWQQCAHILVDIVCELCAG